MRNQIAPIADKDGPNGYRLWVYQLDLSVDNMGFSVDIRGFSDVSMQAAHLDGAWGTGVVEAVRSNNDDHYTAFSPAKELSADGALDFDDYAPGFIGARVKTTDTGIVEITVYARKD